MYKKHAPWTANFQFLAKRLLPPHIILRVLVYCVGKETTNSGSNKLLLNVISSCSLVLHIIRCKTSNVLGMFPVKLATKYPDCWNIRQHLGYYNKITTTTVTLINTAHVYQGLK